MRLRRRFPGLPQPLPFFAKCLELAGHVVYAAGDGVRGLELANVVHPDVGIIDIGLPIMDGYQVARQIREGPQGRGMLLLAATPLPATRRVRRRTCLTTTW